MHADTPPARLTALVCFAEVLSMTAFSGFVTLLPVLAPEFHLSNSEAGVIGGVVLGGYVAGVPFLGPATDRMDVRRVYAVAALVAASGALGFAFLARGFWSALLCHALIGIGLSGTYVPGMKALTDRLHGPWQSRGAAFYGATFGVGASLSLVLCGGVAQAPGWQAAFLVASLGPLAAAALLLFKLERVVPRPGVRPALLGFRPVLSNLAVRPYFFATAAHSWELHAARTWLVAFLTFGASQHGGAASAPVSLALIAAFIYLLGPAASVTGAELALRFGRARLMMIGPVLSGTASLIIGFIAGSPWLALVVFAASHMFLIGVDAGVMNAGVVIAADPGHRGATLTMHSLIGFATGFVAPPIFGVVLDFAGGRGEIVAWGLAFGSLGLVSLLGVIPARQLGRLHSENRTR